MESTGSPKKKLTTSFNIFEDKTTGGAQVSRSEPSASTESRVAHNEQADIKRSTNALQLPLTTSKFVNQLPSPKVRKSSVLMKFFR